MGYPARAISPAGPQLPGPVRLQGGPCPSRVARAAGAAGGDIKRLAGDSTRRRGARVLGFLLMKEKTQCAAERLPVDGRPFEGGRCAAAHTRARACACGPARTGAGSEADRAGSRGRGRSDASKTRAFSCRCTLTHPPTHTKCTHAHARTHTNARARAHAHPHTHIPSTLASAHTYASLPRSPPPSLSLSAPVSLLPSPALSALLTAPLASKLQ